MRDILLYTVILGFASGIFFRSLFHSTYSAALFCVLLAAAFFIVSLLRRERRKSLALFGIFLCGAALGILRFDFADTGTNASVLSGEVGQRVVLEGIVTSGPDRRENSTRIYLAPLMISSVPLEREKKVLVSFPRYPELFYGDRVRVVGKLAKPENFETDLGRSFDYISYLKKDGVEYQISFADVEKIGEGEGNVVIEKLLLLKSAFLESVAEIIPEPEASLLGGITVGAKESLGSDLTETFRTVGLIHIVVLSGYNISIVAESIMRLVRIGGILPPPVSLSLGALSIVLFALMTGAGATVVRASIMALLVVLAKATGRVYAITKALLIAGFFMVLINPYILVFDPSFQLSFMATLGLILLGPHIERYVTFLPDKYGFRGFSVATIATQIFVLPLLLYQSGNLSLVSLPANLLVLIVVPAAMLFGFLTGVTGFVSTVLAYPFGLIAYSLLSYILTVTEFLGSLPFASLHVSYFPAWLLFLSYALLGILCFRMLHFAK